MGMVVTACVSTRPLDPPLTESVATVLPTPLATDPPVAPSSPASGNADRAGACRRDYGAAFGDAAGRNRTRRHWPPKRRSPRRRRPPQEPSHRFAVQTLPAR